MSSEIALKPITICFLVECSSFCLILCLVPHFIDPIRWSSDVLVSGVSIEGDDIDDDYKAEELEDQDLEDELDDGNLGDEDDTFNENRPI